MSDETWPEGTILVMVDGETRPATEEELVEIEARQVPPSPVKLPSITKMQFLPLLAAAIGQARATELLLGSVAGVELFAVIWAGAEKIDYVDVFIGIDGDPEQPCYAAQLLAAEAVTQGEIDDLEASWPTG